MSERRITFATALLLAALIPSAAYACEPYDSAMDVVIFDTVLGVPLAFVSMILVAAVSAGVEGYRAITLDKPRWWKSRIWGVGLLGFVVGALILTIVSALGVYFEESWALVFLMTTPMVLQTAYVCRQWQKRNVLPRQ